MHEPGDPSMNKLNERLTLIANISVVLGIIFLAVEVRHASNATELQTIESVTNGWVGLNEAIVSDPQVARSLIVGLYNPMALSNVEAAQFSMFLRMFTNQVDRVGMHRDLGLVPDTDYESALRQLAQFMDTPGGRRYSETDPGFQRNWADRIQPYRGQEPVFDLILGRDTSALR